MSLKFRFSLLSLLLGTLMVGCLCGLYATWSPWRACRKFYGHEGIVSSLCFSNDDTLLISASRDGTIRIGDIMTGETIAVLVDGLSFATALSISHDKKLLTSVDAKGCIGIWSTKKKHFKE